MKALSPEPISNQSRWLGWWRWWRVLRLNVLIFEPLTAAYLAVWHMPPHRRGGGEGRWKGGGGAEWWQVHHFNICQHALNSSNKKCEELGRQLSETKPLDISRRATPIFCTFSVAFTHSHTQSKDAHPHKYALTHI